MRPSRSACPTLRRLRPDAVAVPRWCGPDLDLIVCARREAGDRCPRDGHVLRPVAPALGLQDAVAHVVAVDARWVVRPMSRHLPLHFEHRRAPRLHRRAVHAGLLGWQRRVIAGHDVGRCARQRPFAVPCDVGECHLDLDGASRIGGSQLVGALVGPDVGFGLNRSPVPIDT